ncbi:MAG: hypothetical protein ABIF88_02345 [archaeon]
MCYSAEVQLATSLFIIIFVLVCWVIYHKKYSTYKTKWENSFLKYALLGSLCIGGHQFFEFLTIVTGNIIIYKIGLIISISSMYFFLRSYEVLVNTKIHSWIALIVVVLTSIHLSLIEMTVSTTTFFVRHHAAFVWAFAWILLLTYLHAVALKEYFTTKNRKEAHFILLLLLFSLDISFIFGLTYVIFGYYLAGLSVCMDFGSIWCTFSVIQTLFIPFILTKLHSSFNREKKTSVQSFKTMGILLLISLAVLIFLLTSVPLFDCAIWKYVFP